MDFNRQYRKAALEDVFPGALLIFKTMDVGDIVVFIVASCEWVEYSVPATKSTVLCSCPPPQSYMERFQEFRGLNLHNLWVI